MIHSLTHTLLTLINPAFLTDEALERLRQEWNANGREERHRMSREFERVFISHLWNFFSALPDGQSDEPVDYASVPVFEKRFPVYTAANWVVRLWRRDTFVRIVIFQMLMEASVFFSPEFH
jgi:hypothetical protein